MHQFCPKCGKTEGEFIGLFCRDCFLLDHPNLVQIPPLLEMERCNRCEKVRLQGNWIPWDAQKIGQWIISQIKSRELRGMKVDLELGEIVEKKAPVWIHVSGELENQPVSFHLQTIFKLKGSICNDDMLVSSDYYEGIIQIRFEDNTPEKAREVKELIENALIPLHAADSKAVVVNWIVQKFGFDAWIVSNKAAKAAAITVARKFNISPQVTSKLIGLSRTGKERHRKTFLLRMP